MKDLDILKKKKRKKNIRNNRGVGQRGGYIVNTNVTLEK